MSKFIKKGQVHDSLPEAVFIELIKKRTGFARSFVDFGCASNGKYSKHIVCELGVEGIGIASPVRRISHVQINQEVDSGKYLLVDSPTPKLHGSKFDFGLTVVKTEALKKKRLFVSDCINSIKKSGQFYFAFPASQFGRIESTIGLMEEAGFKNIELVSSSFSFCLPIFNYLSRKREQDKSWVILQWLINKILVYPVISFEMQLSLSNLGTIIIAVGDKE